MEFNVADLFESLVDAIPDRVALVAGGTRQTFRELDRRTNRLASALRARGIRAGEHVGLHTYNGAEFVESMLALFKLRAVPINVNYRYVADELAYVLENADVVALVTQRELVPVVAPIRERVATLRDVFVVEDASGADLAGFASTSFEELVASGSEARDFEPRSGDDVYMIYTGGTTGMPRGVMWRHEDVFFAGLQGGNPGGPAIEAAADLARTALERDMPMVMLPAAPFIHGAAQWAALIGLFTGGKVVVAPGRSFDAKRVLELIGEEQVNTITLVGDAMARPLVEALREGGPHDTSSLFVISSAGAVLSDSVKAELAELLPNTLIINAFGASETGHQGTVMPGMEAAHAGRPTFYMDESNTVLDEEGRPVEPGSGKVGRLARSGRLPIGYYKDAEKTAATFLVLDGKRWVVPGDMATVEPDGTITVHGRGAVCINSGGEKIFPEEVESALKAHPDVMDAVVVGVPDERWGSRVAAIVQPRAGKRADSAELAAHCRARVAGYKVPREWHSIDLVQRHPSGKPDYKWAKDVAVAAAHKIA